MRGKVQKQQREEEKQRHKEKRRREIGEEKKKKYTCDSSETRRIKRIHRGNVNMHHRFDRIPVRIIPFLFRRWPIHSRRISFSVPLSAFFISLCITCTQPLWSHLLHLRFLLRPTRALIELSQTNLPLPSSLRNNYPRDIPRNSFLSFSYIYIYIRFTFLSVSLSNITRGYDPYVAMPPLISNITPIRERHLCDVSIESICCYRCHVMRGTRV